MEIKFSKEDLEMIRSFARAEFVKCKTMSDKELNDLIEKDYSKQFK